MDISRSPGGSNFSRILAKSPFPENEKFLDGRRELEPLPHTVLDHPVSPHYARLQQQLQEAKSDLSLFEVSDQVCTHMGARSSTRLGLRVPAHGLVAGSLGGLALSFVPGCAPWPLLVGPLLGLVFGIAWEAQRQHTHARRHLQQRAQKQQRITTLEKELGR